MSTTKLKPCAHCGGVAELRDRDGSNGMIFWYVECCACSVGSDWNAQEEAIECWNRRHHDTQDPDEIIQFMLEETVSAISLPTGPRGPAYWAKVARTVARQAGLPIHNLQSLIKKNPKEFVRRYEQYLTATQAHRLQEGFL